MYPKTGHLYAILSRKTGFRVLIRVFGSVQPVLRLWVAGSEVYTEGKRPISKGAETVVGGQRTKVRPSMASLGNLDAHDQAGGRQYYYAK